MECVHVADYGDFSLFCAMQRPAGGHCLRLSGWQVEQKQAFPSAVFSSFSFHTGLLWAWLTHENVLIDSCPLVRRWVEGKLCLFMHIPSFPLYWGLFPSFSSVWFAFVKASIGRNTIGSPLFWYCNNITFNKEKLQGHDYKVLCLVHFLFAHANLIPQFLVKLLTKLYRSYLNKPVSCVCVFIPVLYLLSLRFVVHLALIPSTEMMGVGTLWYQPLEMVTHMLF